MKVRLVTQEGEDVLALEPDDLEWLSGTGVPAPPAWLNEPQDIRCRQDLSSRKIIFVGEGLAPDCLHQYARWSGRELLQSLSISDFVSEDSGPESLLIVASEDHPMWEELVGLLNCGMCRDSAIFFLPYRSERELKRHLIHGAIVAHKKADEVQQFTTVSFQPFRALGNTPPNRLALVIHSRPYCGRVVESGKVTGLCTSPDGAAGYCYGGHLCLFEPTSREAVERLSAPVTFLNGCTTVFPPVRNLPFPADSLLGYRLYRQRSGVIIGNLSLGPAEPWELEYMDAREKSGEDFVTQIRSLNRIRASLGYYSGFRVVGFGDGALLRPAAAEGGGSITCSGNRVVVLWEQPGLSLWAKIPEHTLPHGWKKFGLSAEVRNGERSEEGHVLCLNDPASDYLMLIVMRSSEASREQFFAIEIGIRSDNLEVYSEALKDAVQGVAALMSQGDKWDLQPVFATGSEVLRSLHQSRKQYRISAPSTRTLEALEQGLLNVLTYISQRGMEVFLDLLKRRVVDLGNLYGPGSPQLDDRCGTRKCPICGLFCWERTRAIHGLEGAALVQLQCALCSIVCEAPASIVVDEISIRYTTEAMIITAALRNKAVFPVFLSFKWHAEETSSPGKLSYQELNSEFETVALEAGENRVFSFESEVRFLRVLHFYFSANGYAGFVQIKDAESNRNRMEL
jgi:hypothetical protein